MRSQVLAVLLFLIAPGLLGVYFGLLYAGVECGSAMSGCSVHHAGEVSWVPLGVGVVFLLFGAHALWSQLRAR